MEAKDTDDNIKNAASDLWEAWTNYLKTSTNGNLVLFMEKFVNVYPEFTKQSYCLLNNVNGGGPHLDKLPSDILPCLDRFLREVRYSECTAESLYQIELAFKTLCVICRNFDNIPFIASCDFVNNTTGLLSTLINKLPNDEQELFFSVLHSGLYFLECIYDPYFNWRTSFCRNEPHNKSSHFSPAFLHIEVVPFVYECFHINLQSLSHSFSLLKHCLHLFGAILSGAKYNALKACCPATIEVLWKCISDNNLDIRVRDVAVDCLGYFICVVSKYRPDQTQVDLAVIIREFSERWWKLCDADHIVNNIVIVNKCLEQLQRFLSSSRRAIFQSLQWLDILLHIFKSSFEQSDDEQVAILRISIIQTLCLILRRNKDAMIKMGEINGFQRLLDSFKSNLDFSWPFLAPFLSLVICCHSNGSSTDILHPEVVKFFIQLFPYVKNEEVQDMLIKTLTDIGADIHCKMIYSEAGVLLVAIKTWAHISDLKSAYFIANLIEVFGRYSINANELLHLVKLIRPDKNGSQFPYSHLVMLTLSSVAKKELMDDASCFFDFQESFHGIEIPTIEKWPGYSFCFCSWIRLDNISDLLSSVPVYRRQLYSFTTASDCGFEAFFLPDGILVVAVLVKKEYITVSVNDQFMNDNKWHFITICHSGSRRPFMQGQLCVYIDGKLKLTTPFKFPSMSEPFVNCRIGNGRQKSSSSRIQGVSATGRLLSSLQLSFLSLPMPLKGSGLSDVGTTTIETGRQDQIWGIPNSLQGQMNSVTVFHDVLQPLHIKCMHMAGPNFLTLFSGEDADLADLSSKLVVFYHPKAYDKNICYDLSPGKLYNGQVNGQYCATWRIKESLSCIGGMPALFSILENCKFVNNVNISQPKEKTDIARENSLDDWVVLPSPSSSDWKIEQNEAAGFFLLIKHFMHSSAVYKEPYLSANDVATIGALLKNIPSELVDVHLLMAVQLFLESVNGKDESGLKHAIFQYILFDFKIWSRSTFAVQIGHIQYLATIIKDDRKYFRKKYGIRYLLDVIRQYYSCHNTTLCFDDSKAIRVSLFSIIRYFIMKEINNSEMNSIFGFIVSVKEEVLLTELVDMLLLVMEHHQCKDQIFLLIYEPGCVELFYCLLLNPLYSISFRCGILKLIGVILNTNKVYEKNKVRLRLQDIGLAGLVSRFEGMPLSNEMAKLLVDQVLLADNIASWHGVLVLLYFIRFTDATLKLQVIRKVAQTVLLHSTSLHLIALQHGWHDCILELLIKHPVNNTNIEEGLNSEKASLSLGITGVSPSLMNVSGSPISCSHFSPKNIIDSQMSSPKIKFQPFIRASFDFDVQSMEGRSLSNSKASSLEDLSASQSSDVVHNNVESSELLIEDVVPENDKLEELKIVAESLNRLDSLEVDNFSDSEDELCQLVINIIYLVLWRGISGTEKRAWRERGQVFTCINILALSNHLYRSHIEIKRRILELMLNAAVFDLKEAGQANAIYTENAMVVMKWAFDFVVVDTNRDHSKKLSVKLLDGILSILDTLMVLEESPDGDDWTEMAQMGIRILLECAASENLEICSMATPKLHTLIQTRLTWSKVGEVFFFLEHLDNILIKTVEMQNQDHYSFIIPLIKALLETAGPRLHLEHHLPNLPTNLTGPSLFEEFQQYCQTSEWRTFISKQVRPVAMRHTRPIAQVIPETMNEFWNDCYEETMISIHKRNREWGESRLRFQALIMDSFSNKCIEEQTRYNNVVNQARNQNLIVRRRWRLKKLFLQGPRGPWQKLETSLHWKLSSHENLSRMRLKLILNHNFDIHAEASRLRDNLGLPGPCQSESLPLAVVVEARNTQHQDDSLNEEDLKAFLVSETQEMELSGKEKLILTEDCELVSLMSVVKGRLELTTTHLYFFDISPVKEDAERYDFKFSLDLLEELHLRRYNLRRSALEFFLIDQITYFLNFNPKVRNKVFTRILSFRPPNLVVYSNGSPADVLRSSGYTQKWLNHEVSNFDYLMILNTIAGRTFNDLSQYPVFPWILTDYSSTVLDLNDSKVFRDLSKPLGVVNENNIFLVKAKYEQFEDPSGVVEKFHYGTHYSNSAGVLQYLVRVEPFTTLHIELQSNRFDVADRQFHSIPGTWKMLMENSNDVKELIPEFFYLPEFLLNLNGFDLGQLQGNKGLIGDVVLPPWATDAYDFIFKHRKALESEYVSSHLHEWIDLIFGHKQKGPAAVEALNVFYYCSYEGAVNLDSIEDPFARTAMEGMINNFGQTPCQLLKEPHPTRLTKEEVIEKFSKNDNKGSNLFMCLHNLRIFEVEMTNADDPVIFVAAPRYDSRLGSSTASVEPLVTVTLSGTIGIHNWLPYNKSISSFYTLDIDPSLANPKSQRKLSVPFQPGLNLNSNLFALASNAKLLYSGGHWDNSIRVLKISKGKMATRIIGHKDVVTCLALDRLARHLISGSRDLTCILWDVSRLMVSSTKDVQAKLLHVLCGHTKEVVCVAIMTELDVAVSGSKDGTVNVHTMREGLYLRTLRPYLEDINYEICHLTLTLQGYLVLATTKFGEEYKHNKYALHLYSTNGHHVWEEPTTACTTSITVGEHPTRVVCGNSKGQINIHDVHELKLLKSLSLPSSVCHISMTNRNTHILASLTSGHLMVICVALPVDIK